MSWRKEQGRAERGYHHGNLKEALLQAALGLIAEKGAAGFTFADAARMAGVSPAAPYRHFRDRDELLSSIAQRGFEQFESALSQAWDDGRPDTVTAFERVGKAYLAFAREEPAYYSAMFEAGIPLDLNPDLRAAGDRAFVEAKKFRRDLAIEGCILRVPFVWSGGAPEGDHLGGRRPRFAFSIAHSLTSPLRMRS